ncbi:hypothetical protein BH09PAT2_BH09PAT2_00280 [soil metagenome]
MKINLLILTILISFSLGIHIFAIPTYAIIPENPDRPVIDDGTGNGSYGKGTSTKTLQNVINILFFNGFSSYGLPDSGDSTPTPNTDPLASPTPAITHPPSLTGEGQFADALVADTNKYCGGVISKPNRSCVDNFTSIKTHTKDLIKQSAYDYDYAQCVGGALAVAYERGRTFDKQAANAKLFQNVRATGYTYTPNDGKTYDTLKPGSLFIQNTGYIWGHIGYVTEVNGRSITALEFNWGNGTVKHGRQVPVADLYGWHTPDSL